VSLWSKVERVLDGHVTIGPVTLYGANAMHWGVTISTRRWGYVCFRLPLPCYGAWWPLYFYCSPNATPWASTFYRSTARWDRGDRARADERRRRFGHAFSTSVHSDELQQIHDDETFEQTPRRRH
jgi:hypothetical protein